jgi:hypothetical protein
VSTPEPESTRPATKFEHVVLCNVDIPESKEVAGPTQPICRKAPGASGESSKANIVLTSRVSITKNGGIEGALNDTDCDSTKGALNDAECESTEGASDDDLDSLEHAEFNSGSSTAYLPPRG